ncbi:MAG: hypothetical protein QGG40_13895, partial [Myxococcota bacterium]|nr:hypothetical protein [Myxococcota bacterium]
TGEALDAAWNHGKRPGLLQGESLEDGTVRLEPVHDRIATLYPRQRGRDLIDFYAELELAFYQALDARARQMGFRVPVVPTMPWGRVSLMELYQDWPMTDAHLKWDKGEGRHVIRNVSALAEPTHQELILQTVHAAQGKAFAVSELNHVFPNRYMAEAVLLWASVALVQDWDVLLWNSFPIGDETEDASWMDGPGDHRNATVKLAQNMTASSLFRGAWLSAAEGFYPVHHTHEEAMSQAVYGKAHKPLVVREIDVLLSHRIRRTFGDAPPEARAGEPVAGIGWWQDPGLLVLDLPQVQARVGPPVEIAEVGGDGAGPREPSRLRVELEQWAAVSLAAVDGESLEDCSQALLTIGTRQENSGMAWAEDYRFARAFGVPPVLIQPARGRIAFQWSQGRPTVETLGTDGGVTGALRVRRVSRGWWGIELDEKVQTPLLLVSSAEASRGG